uniref:RNA helicase n=2 Tax=Clastoptera arizonana TaxID=38151 RepID=A0A1B6EFR9_9HEMI
MSFISFLGVHAIFRRSVKCTYERRKSEFFCKCFSSKIEEDLINIIYPDIKGEAQPLPGKFRPSKQKKRQGIFEPKNDEKAIIECKTSSLNHYKNQTYKKFDAIPLASKGWHNKQSRGDYFKINIIHDESQKNHVFWKDEHLTFADLKLDLALVAALEKLGYTKPTKIQADGIPIVLRSLNTVLAGETGCGKTLAYLIPIIQQILLWKQVSSERRFNTPLALIMTPSRELAEQIGMIAKQLGNELQFDSYTLIGGHTKKIMLNPDFYPIDLLIGSVGVISKLTTTGILNMSCVRHIVLDEADSLLDDSFNEKVTYYLKKFPLGFKRLPATRETEKLPELCQLTLASATMPTSIATVLGDIINVDSLEKVQTPRLHHVLTHVPQLFLRLGQSQKPGKLLEIVKKNVNKNAPTIIFSNRSGTCDWVSLFLNENDVRCVNLNGDMASVIRLGKFKQFQEGDIDVISCSDIGSRGLDTTRAKHVINYDFPNFMADYIHRCGRTGRIGSGDNCLITNFVSGYLEVELVKKIEASVRTMTQLPNVNANITKIIHHKILNKYENFL